MVSFQQLMSIFHLLQLNRESGLSSKHNFKRWTKSIPTWCQGEWTGTGWSSGVVVVTFPFTRWHTSQVETFKDNLKASYYYYFYITLTYSLLNIFNNSLPGKTLVHSCHYPLYSHVPWRRVDMARLHNPSLLLSLLDVPHQLFRQWYSGGVTYGHKTLPGLLSVCKKAPHRWLQTSSPFVVSDASSSPCSHRGTASPSSTDMPAPQDLLRTLARNPFRSFTHPLGRATAFCTPPSRCEPSRDKIWQGWTFIGANFIATFCPNFSRADNFFRDTSHPWNLASLSGHSQEGRHEMAASALNACEMPSQHEHCMH